MRAHALPQIRALADVEGQRIEAVEKIDARGLGQRIERIRRELRWQARRSQDALRRRFDRLRREVAIERLHEVPEHASVAERPDAARQPRVRAAR